jgi:PrtD family type I secretion system ABC transporter
LPPAAPSPNRAPSRPATHSPLHEALLASRHTLWGLGAFSVFINILMLSGPLYMLQVYDRVLASGSIPTLVALSLLVLVLYATMGLLDWCRQALFTRVGSKLEGQLSAPALQAAMAQSLSDPGKINEQPLRDLRALRRFIGGPVLPAAFDAPLSPIFFVVLFMLHWAFGLWALAGGAILVVLAVIQQATTAASIRKADLEEQQAQARASEMLRHSELVEALGMRQRLSQRWQNQLDSSDAALITSGERLSAYGAGTKTFRLILQSGILGLGAWLVLVQQASPGAMIAASILMGRAIAPVEQIVSQWRTLIQARIAWANLNQALGRAAASSESMALPPIRGQVDLEGVAAGPPGSRTPTLRGITLSIAPGDCVGVIGPSASGKSTLARVICGIWRPLAGVVRFDGADISAMPRDRLGPQIGYLPQQVDLFAGSVKDNIARFDPDATPQAIIAAAQAAGCHDMILRLPQGYDSEIGERGAYLSAGQRQRIGLARALYADPMLVVLDEPNSNLDTDGDAALADALNALKARGASVVIIAHRPNTITPCNRLVVLDAGTIRLNGPRDEVLAQLAAPRGRVTPLRKEPANG